MIQKTLVRTLENENQRLRFELRQANVQIRSLKHEISNLQERLSYYENEETTINHRSYENSSEEVFTSSSQEEQTFLSDRILDEEPIQQSIEFEERKQIEKVPALSLNRMVSNMEIQKEGTPPKHTPKTFNFQYQNRSQTKNRAVKEEILSFSGENLLKSEQKNSAIKCEESIISRHPNLTIFNKLKPSKPFYNTFFMTNYSSSLQPEISYFYPRQSNHFSALLMLLYSPHSLKPQQYSKSKHSTKIAIRDAFVIPLHKSVEKQEYEYLVGCQIEDSVKDREGVSYFYPRYLCFLTHCRFFHVYEKIIQQFIEKLNKKKSQLCPKVLQSQIQEHLQILGTKNIEENQYVNFGLGNNIKIFIDVPSAEQSYKVLLQYRSCNTFEIMLQFGHSEGKILGYLLIYMLTESKVILYSSTKSKISEILLHALEIMKPFQYVNPIIMASMRDEHEEYLSAPMSIILGLWSEGKRHKKKIEIFMNKKENLLGMIEKGTIQMSDGVVFNLDTGYCFGGALSKTRNLMGEQLNFAFENRPFKDRYKLFEKMLKPQVENSGLRELWKKLKQHIKNTQLYSFYQEKHFQPNTF